MYRSIYALLTICLSLPAFAQDFTFVEPDAPVFRIGQPGVPLGFGMGRPTVVYDEADQQYVMILEARLTPTTHYDPADYAGCSTVFGMFRLTSPDGKAWTFDAAPVMVPEPGGYAQCAAAHPNMLIDDAGTYHLYFKGEQAADVCSLGEEPAWGCTQFTGIGYATSEDGGETWDVSPEPAISFSDLNYDGNLYAFGYPTIAAYDGVWFLFISRISLIGYDAPLTVAMSTNFGESWTVDQEPVFDVGWDDWVNDEIVSPVPFCDPEGETFSMFFGGRTLDETPSDTSDFNNEIMGFGYAVGFDPYQWYPSFETPYFHWELGNLNFNGDGNWPHWTGIKVGDDYVIYHTERVVGVDGIKAELQMSFTNSDFLTENWDPAAIEPPICFTSENDSDNDGLSNSFELTVSETSPDDSDSDDDGLPDGLEYNGLETDPNDADTDNDGLTDFFEFEVSHTDPTNNDTDGDGLTDGMEVDSHHTNPLLEDSDSDGLTDSEEIGLGTHPGLYDTDSGGVGDGQEVENETNPLDPSDDVEEDTDNSVPDDTDDSTPDDEEEDRGCCKTKSSAQDAWIILPLLGVFLRRRNR